MKIEIQKLTLQFKQPAGTSRGVYTSRDIRLIHISDPANTGKTGVGESSPLPDLSCDAVPDYDIILRRFCDEIEETGTIPYDRMRHYPSMLFGVETALLDLASDDACLFDTPFSRGEEGIPINGLVWMGDYDAMLQRMEEKLAAGFRCIKLKIGAIDFSKEIELIRLIRSAFDKHTIELRVDANGAFSPDEAMQRLETLSKYDIHSIEQPIRQGQWCAMSRLCRESPIAIALDEELIGINTSDSKQRLLDTIQPQYIILKPTLHGSIKGSSKWIELARERGIGSWITSALESNVGLNAIAQFASHIYGPGISMPQGLGTGALFTKNIPMHLEIRQDKLWRNIR